MHSDSWLGTVGYMIVLDQLGSALRPSAVSPATGPQAFVMSLEYFAPELRANDREALYSLRNALVHDYSLVDKGTSPHLFKLVADDTTPIVAHPKIRYDRSNPSRDQPREDQLAGSKTIVNLRAFAHMVEEIVVDVRDLAQRDGVLVIALEGGQDALAFCHSFSILVGEE